MLLIGVAAGGAVAWVVATLIARTRASAAQVEAEARARTAEGAAEPLRAQIAELKQAVDARDSEIKSLTKRSTEAETRLEGERKNFDQQIELLEASKKKLTEAFAALAAEALNANNQAFLDLARTKLETAQIEARGEMETREQAVSNLVAPLKEALLKYEQQIQEMEKTRQRAYGALDEQLRTLTSANEALQKQTGTLVTALRAPQVRGKWGELQLRRVAELAGMSDKCDFVEQESLPTETGRQRPDMIVQLPGGRQIAVDAKTPLSAFLDATGAETEEQRKTLLIKHAQLVRQHLEQLAAKQYWEQFQPAPEVVVLFLPESSFAAALEYDRTIIEDGIQKRVILATPTTLIALLKAIAYGWRQQQIEQNALEISDLGKQLYERITKFVEHLAGVGSSLDKAVERYNAAVGSLEGRVLVSARKFKELGAASTSDDMAEIGPVERSSRALTAGEQGSQISKEEE